MAFYKSKIKYLSKNTSRALHPNSQISYEEDDRLLLIINY